MADLTRSAKSASNWTNYDLEAFNIHLAPTNATEFFGNPELPQSSISPTILDNLTPPNTNVTVEEMEFFQHLSSVENGFDKYAVNDFVAYLLRQLKYNNDRLALIRSRKAIRFIMSGQQVHAQADVCLITDGFYSLLVQVDKRRVRGNFDFENVEPQLIAKAIAAFHENNLNRKLSHLEELTYKLMPAIVMIGTAVVFYSIRVTKTLESAVTEGCYPEDETVVLRFIPPVPDNDHYLDRGNGMRPLENRRIVFQCFEALRKWMD